MKKTLLSILFFFSGLALFSQTALKKTDLETDCTTDFFTITSDGHIQQWSLAGGAISGGDTVLSGGGLSLGYCGASGSPTFYTDNWNQGEIGINYYEPDSSDWINIPTMNHVQDNGGHLNDQYYTVVGGVIQFVNYWDGTNLHVIDSLPGEFFAGIFDIGVDTSGHAWIFTASTPGTAMDSLKVYDSSGQIDAYSFSYDLQGYGSFFLNDTLYLGTVQDSIFPVLINGNTAQLGTGIAFSGGSFTDMASCQDMETTTSIRELSHRKIKLFPNPTSGYVKLPSGIQKSDVLVYNAMGQTIEWKLEGNTLDLMKQPPGIYYIQINSENRFHHHTVVKQ